MTDVPPKMDYSSVPDNERVEMPFWASMLILGVVAVALGYLIPKAIVYYFLSG